MTLPSARITIPVEWGKKAHCPICGANPLIVIHPFQRPDEFQCSGCGAEFELEQGGSRIWLVVLPRNLQEQLAVRWVTIEEVQAEVQKLNHQLEPPVNMLAPEPIDDPTSASNDNQNAAIFTVPVADMPAPPAPIAALPLGPNPQFVAQARDLYALGNTIKQIRAILGRTKGVKPEELDAILAEVTHLDRKKHNRQTRNLVIAAFVSLILVSCCLAAVYTSQGSLSIFQKNAQPGNPPAASNPSTLFNLSNLPGPMKTLMPAGMTIANPSPPVIIKGAGTNSSTYPCPQLPSQAAQLFGGLTENWSFNQGWVMISKTPARLQLPAGMTAGYVITNPDLEMKSISGPVTIQNIYMVIISCD